jgi:molybdopterin/thiamine biosynthesis adenylyltransferase
MFTFRPTNIPTNIFVVGCGGTGSRLIPSLIQFIRSITREHVPTGWLGNTNIILIDGDIVEQKNLIRQNFIASDVGKNKAAVLANRYGKAYGMNVVAHPKFITEGTSPDRFRNEVMQSTGLQLHEYNDMVIMCVDSAAARKIVMMALTTSYDSVQTTFIDAGNEDSFGQVRMFHNTILLDRYSKTEEDLRNKFRNPDRIELESAPLEYIPYDPLFYDNLKDNPGLGSCADLDQTLAINSLMATLIMSFVQNYYYVKTIDYNEVSIDIVKGSCAYTKNTVSNYRNKTIRHSDTNFARRIGAGIKEGVLGTSIVVDVEGVIGTFLKANEAALKTLLAEQSQDVPSLEEIKSVAKKKKIKNKSEVEIESQAVPRTLRGIAGLAQAEHTILAAPVIHVDTPVGFVLIPPSVDTADYRVSDVGMDY